MKIVVLSATLEKGGAERVITLLANGWVKSGHSVEIITYQSADAVPAFELVPEVAIRSLDLMPGAQGPVGAKDWLALRARPLLFFMLAM